MRGSFRIIIDSLRTRYDITIRHNITIIIGNSGTGKTALLNELVDIQNQGDVDNGISIVPKADIWVTDTFTDFATFEAMVSGHKNCLVFIDESIGWVYSADCFSVIQNNPSNYYILIARHYNGLRFLDVDIDAVTQLYHRDTDNTNILVPWSPDTLPRRGYYFGNVPARPEYIYTEDSKSGYYFFNSVCKNDVFPLAGKLSVFKCLKTMHKDACNLIVVDGAAFGLNLHRLAEGILLSELKDVLIYAPPSFEWLLLHSSVFENPPKKIYNKNLGQTLRYLHNIPIKTILATPENFIDSSLFRSRERFYFALISVASKERGFSYAKGDAQCVLFAESNVRYLLSRFDMLDLSKWGITDRHLPIETSLPDEVDV